MTTPIKLSELEAKAREASDAPWVKVEDGKFRNLLPKYSIDCNRQNSMSGDPVVVCENLKHKDAEFITEANPLTISRLCEALRIAHGSLRMYENVALKCIDPELPDINFAESGIKKINDLVDLS